MWVELLADEYCWKELNSLVSSRNENTHARFRRRFSRQLSMNLRRIRRSVDGRHKSVCSCFSASFRTFSCWLRADREQATVSETSSLAHAAVVVVSAAAVGSSWNLRRRWVSTSDECWTRRSQRKVCPLEQMFVREMSSSDSDFFKVTVGLAVNIFLKNGQVKITIINPYCLQLSKNI